MTKPGQKRRDLARIELAKLRAVLTHARIRGRDPEADWTPQLIAILQGLDVGRVAVLGRVKAGHRRGDQRAEQVRARDDRLFSAYSALREAGMSHSEALRALQVHPDAKGLSAGGLRHAIDRRRKPKKRCR